MAKTYEYRVYRETICPPFLDRYVLACSWPMDVDAMRKAAKHFEGDHDFLSFAAKDPDLTSRGPSGLEPDQYAELPKIPRTTVRTIFSSAWKQKRTETGEFLIYRVRGSGFLHHMVRNLVGTMLDVGRGRLKSEEIPEMLAARARSASGPTAPARGLFLHSVEYGEQK